jgi:hypothetical protein
VGAFDNAAGPVDRAGGGGCCPIPSSCADGRREKPRRLACDYGVAQTTVGRWFARPEVARQLHELRRRLQAPS